LPHPPSQDETGQQRRKDREDGHHGDRDDDLRHHDDHPAQRLGEQVDDRPVVDLGADRRCSLLIGPFSALIPPVAVFHVACGASFLGTPESHEQLAIDTAPCRSRTSEPVLDFRWLGIGPGVGMSA
jgi:hypothetical protein